MNWQKLFFANLEKYQSKVQKMVHALYLDSEDSISIYLDDDRYDDFYHYNFRGTSMKADWKAPPYIFTKNGKLKDFLPGRLSAPFISARAKDALEPLIGSYVEFLPAIVVKNVEYYALNIIQLVNCVDLSKSEVSYAANSSEKVMNIFKFCFHETNILNVPMFKVPDDPTIIFVNNDFIKAVLENRLTGVGVENPSELSIMKPHVSSYPGMPVI